MSLTNVHEWNIQPVDLGEEIGDDEFSFASTLRQS
jgi:hypothetical protein